jgi:AcrR family transcriptional regulator
MFAMPTSPPRTSLRDEQRALTRRRLLDAAGAVFARRGFHGSSVEEIAREAGATTGALYSNFTSKEDLFLALFEQSVATDVREYSRSFNAGGTAAAEARAGADRFMQILRERPDYFPLFIEFWAYAIREPALQERFAVHLATLRSAAGRLAAEGAERRGISLSKEQANALGFLITALGNGLALEKLADPAAVPDELYGDLLVLIFEALTELARKSEGDGPSNG